jgi:gas vesicle protein
MKFHTRHLVFLFICLFISLSLTNAYPTNTVELERRGWWKKAKKAVQRAGNNVKNAAQNVGNNVKNAAQNAGNGVKNAAQNVGSNVKNAAQNVGNGVKNAAETVGSNVKNAAEKAGSNVKNAAETVGSNVKNAAETVGSNVKNAAETVGSNVKNAAETVGSNVKNAAETVGSNVKNAAEKAGEKAGTTVRFALASLIHKGNDLARKLGIDTAALGAMFLDMKKDSNGIYHAAFDCWQSAFGYNKLYDIVFALGTSMDYNNDAIFSYNGEKYILWAWKGDYINLGAGAELGIYYGGSGKNSHWKVKKSLAMPMTLTLTHKKKGVIVNNWTDRTWWITAFNPKYQNVKASDLVATYTVKFSDGNMFNAFQKTKAKGWSFNSNTNTATLVL